jgi:DNA-binding NtrC family response regulator
MSKLWIVHRNPNQRAALARIAGLEPTDVASGAPREDEFARTPAPAAVLLGLEGDFELELEFAHRLRTRLPGVSWILLAAPEDASEALRLFESIEPEILESMPTARVLRARIAGAMARRTAASLAERRQRGRVAERFSAWLGGVEVPGLLRALDPSLSALPLLVRGVPGSGRALLCHYVELFRGGSGPNLRLHGRDIDDAADLARRIAATEPGGPRTDLSVWIDEVDRLPASVQETLAEWILHGTPPGGGNGEPPRWIATAGPASWQDRLEPGLQHAFAPLEIDVPSLADHPETLPIFADEVARDWARSVRGPARRFASDALEALGSQSWQGDRAEVESVLRATLAASSADPIEAEHLLLAPAHAADFEETGPSTPIAGSRAEPRAGHEAAAAPRPDVGQIDGDDDEGLFATEVEVEAAQPAAVLDAAFEEPGDDESVLLSETSFALADQIGAEEEAAEPTESTAKAGSGNGWRRLARSLSHEIRNPLVSIRTFAELLPDHYEDETFRERFVELVGQDVAHIGDVLTRLSSVAEQEKLETEAFDVSEMIEELLGERRELIQERRLLVLRELERDAPLALADPKALRVALAGLLDRALESLPERGDLFVATRHIGREARGASRLRVLLRHHSPELVGDHIGQLEELSPAANALEYVLAQTVVEATGGSLTIDSTDAQETLILVDLRTPA